MMGWRLERWGGGRGRQRGQSISVYRTLRPLFLQPSFHKKNRMQPRDAVLGLGILLNGGKQTSMSMHLRTSAIVLDYAPLQKPEGVSRVFSTDRKRANTDMNKFVSGLHVERLP